MDFVFMCDNEKCMYFNKKRKVSIEPLCEGLFDVPKPICVCGTHAQLILGSEQ